MGDYIDYIGDANDIDDHGRVAGGARRPRVARFYLRLPDRNWRSRSLCGLPNTSSGLPSSSTRP